MMKIARKRDYFCQHNRADKQKSTCVEKIKKSNTVFVFPIRSRNKTKVPIIRFVAHLAYNALYTSTNVTVRRNVCVLHIKPFYFSVDIQHTYQ